MEDFFIGEIRYVAFNFEPKGWAFCDGRLLSIAQNTALFSLLGTTFGGNGQTTFALPDLRGRVSMGQGDAPGLEPYTLGEQSGTEAVTLLQSQMPAHNHTVAASSLVGTTGDPGAGVFAQPNLTRGGNLYAASGAANAAADTITPAGGSQPHNNMAPGLVLNAVIALQGIFPPRD